MIDIEFLFIKLFIIKIYNFLINIVSCISQLSLYQQLLIKKSFISSTERPIVTFVYIKCYHQLYKLLFIIGYLVFETLLRYWQRISVNNGFFV